MRGLVARAIDWLGGHELVMIVGLLIVAAGSWLFALLAAEVLEGSTQRFDEKIVRALRKPDDPRTPIGPSWLPEVGRDITALGGTTLTVLITAAVVGFLVLDRKTAASAFVLLATASGFALSAALKSAFRRPRPSVVPHLMEVHYSSFPSGHSMMSAVVYLTLGVLMTRLVTSRRLKVYFLSVAVILTVLVGLSRVYMGVHYPTDVLAGWTAGVVWASLCWVTGLALQRRGQMEKRL